MVLHSLALASWLLTTMDMRNWRKSGGTKTIYLGRHYVYQDLQESVKLAEAHNYNAGSKKQTWKTLLRKLSNEKRKIFESSKLVKTPYDEQSYMQNFDDGQMLDDELDNDILSRSFSVRFADPSKLFHEKDELGM